VQNAKGTTQYLEIGNFRGSEIVPIDESFQYPGESHDYHEDEIARHYSEAVLICYSDTLEECGEEIIDTGIKREYPTDSIFKQN
jgi:hypothetical protein